MTTFAMSLKAHPYEDGWSAANSLIATGNRAVDKANSAYQRLEVEAKTQARKLGIKVPWKWRG
jgi:hypothetical protein